MLNLLIYLFMSKSHNPAEVDRSAILTDIFVKVSSTCVVNLTRPSSNPEKPIQRQYLVTSGDLFKISASPASPVTIGVIPFEKLPDSLKFDSHEL